MSMRNVIFWRFSINYYICLGVFGLYYHLCRIYFNYSEIWNDFIAIGLFLFYLYFYTDDNYIYCDNYSDIKIMKLKLKRRFKI